MRVAFRADGDAIIGTGHLSRCHTIAAELQCQQHDVCFFCRSGAIPWLQHRKVPFIELPHCDDLREEEKVFLEKAHLWHADWVITDSYALDEAYYKAIYGEFRSAVIDDYARLPYSADILINANLYASGLEFSGVSAQLLLLGGEYAILREEFRNMPIPPFREKVKRILIAMGGADINSFTLFVISALQEIQVEEILVIMGAYAQCIQQVQGAAKACASPVRVVVAPNNIAELFASCDLAISASGSTVYELCGLGVPLVLVEQAENQHLIAKYFRESGTAKVLQDHKKITAEELYQAAADMIVDENSRRHMRAAGMRAVDINGVSKITQQLLLYSEINL